MYRIHGLSHILGLVILACDQIYQIVEFASNFVRDKEYPASGGAFDQATKFQFWTISAISVVANCGRVDPAFGLGSFGG